MSTILRIWKSVPKGPSNWIIWDRGDEIWELKDDVLRHFEVLERKSIDNVITEHLRPLRESAIPLEAIRHSVHGWQIEESTLPVLLETSQLIRKTGESVSGESVSVRKMGNKKSIPDLPLVDKTSHEKLLQSSQEIQEEESSQHFYNHPTELWSSLSQWIPQHALFQPSLHHQATLELSDTPAQTYPYQIDSSENSRPAQAQHRHVKQGQHSKIYRPKTFLREIELPKRPLFV